MAVAPTYVCRECGRASLRWEGRCPGCNAWNALEEAAPLPSGSGRSGRSGGRRGPEPRPLREGAEHGADRMRLGLGDIDRVLGGGLVSGSVQLLAGPPGIGKSTLLLQAAGALAARGERVLYVSGEESEGQVARRAARLGEAAGDVLFRSETSVDAIVSMADEVRPVWLCVDSIQTSVSDGTGTAGSVSQVRTAGNALRAWAKASGTPVVLVGHVTKGGGIAGPRTLEHMVDVVLHFERLAGEDVRILRATKNRFGRVGELALFTMSDNGLRAVADPGRALLRDRADRPGSALTATIEGTRAVPIELQALTMRSGQPSARRMTTGFPARRLAMVLAVLERRGGLALDRSDVFVNVVGGLRVADPVADACVIAALVSAERDMALPAGSAFLGEVGLTGELRRLGAAGPRLEELRRIGVTDIVLPGAGASVGAEAPPGVRVHPVDGVRELVVWVAERSARSAPDGAA